MSNVLTLRNARNASAVLGVVALLVAGGWYLILGFESSTRIILAVGILFVGVAFAIEPEAVVDRAKTRAALYGGNTVAIAAIIIGILAVINVLGSRRHERWDLSASQQNSLSDETLKIVRGLSEPIEAIAFFDTEDTRRREFEDLLREFQVRADGNFSYRFVNPVEAPGAAREYQIKELGTTVLLMADRRQQITGTRESDVTPAILRLVQPQAKKAYFTTGHGERRLDGFDLDSFGNLKATMESDNFTIEALNLFATAAVPDDATFVVIGGPRQKFGDEEVGALGAYLDRGGKILIMVDPKVDAGLGPIYARWKLEVGQAYAVDTDRNSFFRSPFNPVVSKYPVHRITEQQGLVLFPAAVALSPSKEPQRGVIVTPLAQTSANSWVETDEAAQRDPQAIKFDEGADTKGPLSLAVAVEVLPDTPPGTAADATGPKTRAIVIGTSRIVSNEVFQLGGQITNRDFVLNAMNWLADAEELISIRARPSDDRKIFMSPAQQYAVLYSTALFAPALVLAGGVAVWWTRR
ncbi:MAG: Gldg family protein [Chloroflexota bacterium]